MSEESIEEKLNKLLDKKLKGEGGEGIDQKIEDLQTELASEREIRKDKEFQRDKESFLKETFGDNPAKYDELDEAIQDKKGLAVAKIAHYMQSPPKKRKETGAPAGKATNPRWNPDYQPEKSPSGYKEYFDKHYATLKNPKSTAEEKKKANLELDLIMQEAIRGMRQAKIEKGGSGASRWAVYMCPQCGTLITEHPRGLEGGGTVHETCPNCGWRLLKKGAPYSR